FLLRDETFHKALSRVERFPCPVRNLLADVDLPAFDLIHFLEKLTLLSPGFPKQFAEHESDHEHRDLPDPHDHFDQDVLSADPYDHGANNGIHNHGPPEARFG